MSSPEAENVIPLRLCMGKLGPDDTGERVYLQGFDAVFRRYHPYVTTVIYRLVADRGFDRRSNPGNIHGSLQRI